jgi:hypothetical protein
MLLCKLQAGTVAAREELVLVVLSSLARVRDLVLRIRILVLWLGRAETG